ncbi:MAG: heat shock protein HspQ [gamma proteobacterium symbiont of Ctena orbiculata]|nr:heat shock protein HspQ [Candidatus Thiodiazotropha taylori]MBT3059672.1 heat shock protein HspQ [Candidatus Thiodiazotropha sp. (ex Lucina pensylvanica)]MBT3062938.1 heat shock protein HspQ [Candidatus Thiodiazotropha sp. (ex Lucina pensylvanica)]PUB75228.1 MAG: heat shock protein HspQ [gamma proteobacterium symbiont of Ctena orbiculata]PUB80260.1 MAG: heat shock protein HspQ [gamma proteobacterium symbiont of Ctena orbiculata]
MSSEIETTKAKFSVGELVHHRLFDYRGVIVDVDAQFMLSDEWYDQVARSRPPKDQPWYRVLVHSSNNETYVAERNLTLDENIDPVDHPLVKEFFDDFVDGRYTTGKRIN